MSSPSLVEAGLKPNETVEAPARSGPHPIVPALGSALVLWTTFPPADWSWFAWVALVPLFLLIRSQRPAWSVYGSVWFGGMVFWTLTIRWVRLTDSTAWLAWLTMALALSAFWPAFLALSRLAMNRLRLPLMIVAPVVWVALEYVRAYAVTGFPWYYLAHSQHAVLPVIQVADLTGSLGISFVIAVVNAWVVDLLTLPLLRPTRQGVRLTLPQALRLGVVVTMIGAMLGYGAYRLGTAHFRSGPRVALIQSSFIQRYKSGNDPNDLAAVYYRLVIRAAQAEKRPDLIVWPETSYPFNFIAIASGLDPATVGRQLDELGVAITAPQWLDKRDKVSADLHSLSDRLGVSMLVGSLTYDHRPEGLSRYNAALLFQPGVNAIQSFNKIHLVPFGEYVPLIETFPWLVALTPYHGTHIPSLTFGKGPVWMELGPYRLATAICFEDTVPHVVRRSFSEMTDGRQPDLLLNMSNDGWFCHDDAHASEEHAMHLAVSVFRAVENRVPLARAANTGVSAIVDGNGRVVKSLPSMKQDILAGEVPLDDRVSIYSSWGDWLGQSCLAVTIGLVPLAFFWPARGRRLVSPTAP